MKKPKTLKSPRKSVSEDLSNLLGLGEKAKIDLNNLGIYHSSQISKWNSDEFTGCIQFIWFAELE